MTHTVSVGGGITSTLLLPLKVIEKYGRQNVTLVMAMLATDEKNARPLVEAVEKHLDMKIERITCKPDGKGWRYIPDGRWALYDIWDVFFWTGRMGSSLADPCSRILKREVLASYMSGGGNLHVGITADEIDRMLAIQRNWKSAGVNVYSDLADDWTLTREKAITECQRILGFVPEGYQIGASHNNCAGESDTPGLGMGGCVKAGHAQMARFLYHNRVEYLRWEVNELHHQRIFDHASTIMRDRITRGGKVDSTPLTLRDFRHRMESRWESMLPGFDPFEGLDETPGCKWCEAA